MFVSVSSAYYFNIFDFIYSTKYLSLLKTDIVLISVLILILLSVLIIYIYKKNKIIVPLWFSISLILLVLICDNINGTARKPFILFGINYNNEKMGKIVDDNIASSALLTISMDLMNYYEQKKNEYTGSKVENIFYTDIAQNFQFVKQRENIILVIMESFGLNADSLKYLKIIDPILKLRPYYNVSIIKERFYGSTIAAESKELLGYKGIPYNLLKNKSFMDTLISVPKILKMKGFVSYAFHGFSGSMFERKYWWNNIGFDSIYFLEDFVNPESILVGKALPGISDRLIIKSIKDKIEVNGYPNPFFIYVLTLNAHLPLSKNLTNVYQISNYDDLEVPQILDSINHTILRDIADLIKVTKNTNIFIVGDHPPPLGNNLKRYYDERYIPVIVVVPKK